MRGCDENFAAEAVIRRVTALASDKQAVSGAHPVSSEKRKLRPGTDRRGIYSSICPASSTTFLSSPDYFLLYDCTCVCVCVCITFERLRVSVCLFISTVYSGFFLYLALFPPLYCTPPYLLSLCLVLLFLQFPLIHSARV